jgi:hypothetical protein
MMMVLIVTPVIVTPADLETSLPVVKAQVHEMQKKPLEHTANRVAHRTTIEREFLTTFAKHYATDDKPTVTFAHFRETTSGHKFINDFDYIHANFFTENLHELYGEISDCYERKLSELNARWPRYPRKALLEGGELFTLKCEKPGGRRRKRKAITFVKAALHIQRMNRVT